MRYRWGLIHCLIYLPINFCTATAKFCANLSKAEPYNHQRCIVIKSHFFIITTACYLSSCRKESSNTPEMLPRFMILFTINKAKCLIERTVLKHHFNWFYRTISTVSVSIRFITLLLLPNFGVNWILCAVTYNLLKRVVNYCATLIRLQF